MKYCSHCGKKMDEEATVCPSCGAAVNRSAVPKPDAPSALYMILGFLFPVVGVILYFLNEEKAPLRAKSAYKGAVIGLTLEISLACGGALL